MSLQETYFVVDEAEKLVSKNEYLKASILYKKAAESFKASLLKAETEDIGDNTREILKCLAKEHETRAVQLEKQDKLKKIIKHKDNEKGRNKKSNPKPSLLDSIVNLKSKRLDSRGPNNGFMDYSIINKNEPKMEAAMDLNFYGMLMIVLESARANDLSVIGSDEEILEPKVAITKTKEELIMENRQLKANVVEMNRQLRRLNIQGEDSQDLLLINKKKFEEQLAGVLEKNEFGRNKQFGVNSEASSLSNQIISDKEAEISRLQQLVRGKDRQNQKLSTSLRKTSLDKSALLDNYNKLQKDHLSLQSKLQITNKVAGTPKKLAPSRHPALDQKLMIIQSDDDDDDDEDDLYEEASSSETDSLKRDNIYR